jgi:flagellar hook-associated protein FlgK
MPDSLLIALSGLSAQQRAMEVTSHNIANATTPGFSRQRLELTTQLPESIRPGQLGRGVSIDAVRRSVDDLLINRLRLATAELGRLDSLDSNLKNLELAFNEPGDAGLAKATADLFSAFEDLSNNSDSSALRSTAAQSVETWTANLRDLADRLQTLRDDYRGALESEVEAINDLTAEIGGLNQSIRAETNLGNNPNDLLDRRDELIRQLAERIDIRTRPQPDGAVLIDSDGALLVGLGGANPLTATVASSGDLQILTAGGNALVPSGGRVAALMELQGSIVPGLQSDIDDLASTVARALNQLHATATSHAYRAQSHLGSVGISFADVGLDLDDPALVPDVPGADGIPAPFAPSFRDANGVLTARNLTINVLDTTTGIATKHTIRFDPAVDTGRSLRDLVTAINTGSGGGFALVPPSAGIPGVTAEAVAVDGAFRLRLTAAAGRSIDFSPALDVRPTATVWTGPALSINTSGSDPAFANAAIGVRATTTGDLEVFTRDALTGAQTIHGSVVLAAGGLVSVGGIALTFPADAGLLRPGDSFAVAIDSAGAPPPVLSVAPAWGSADASMTIKGRYTGQLSYDPARPWSARVVTAGVIGAPVGTAPPGNPPLVEFTYWTGSADAPEQRKLQVLLDNTKPAGTPITIADGVYAQFGVGPLSTAGNQVAFNPDAQPDQAGLLGALGVNALFSGSRALDIDLAERVAADPTQLSVGQTRAQGDNSRLLEMIGVRESKLFGGGAFTLEDRYQGLVAGIGARAQQAERSLESQTILTQSLEGRRASQAGVNIDEEVGNLILQQQAYAAAARVVSTARENIQTLLDILR